MKYKSAFDNYASEYDLWYEQNKTAYLSELKALREFFKPGTNTLEIGVGTGRFAQALGIKFGVDISFPMLSIAKKRGLNVISADILNLPFKKEIFDLCLIALTLCFVQEPFRVLNEVKRVLKKKAKVVLGFIDKDSFLGRAYQLKKEKSLFYKKAHFYSVPQVLELLEEAGFKNPEISQTLFDFPQNLKSPPTPIPGYGKGGFVVVASLR